jgi:hypothetical protein
MGNGSLAARQIIRFRDHTTTTLTISSSPAKSERDRAEVLELAGCRRFEEADR